ncbi:MAG: aminotransferase class III-fold pyridoxal phosphate-dependent enzyme, partial [Candidatus Micrarchaeota archaeon]|nr:aminotransferase class III-fold pyridoxal phosphate-dependent enzyme [Candidatus Micrarchaeota archaeon]
EYPSCGMECVDYIKNYTLKKDVSAKEVSAIFMEPIQGEGGYIVPPKEFVKEIRKIASDNGILLVSDEVQAGYMRTGKFLAMSNFDVEADMYTMAKAIGGGLPMGVTIVKSSLGDLPEGAHSNTFGGNLVSIAAADALLKYVKKNIPSIEDQAQSKGKLVMSRFEAMQSKCEIIGDVRGIGFMVGIELVKDRKTKEPAVKERDEIITECFNAGLILLPAGESTIRIIPPITISHKNLEDGLAILESAIISAARKLGK